MNKLIKSILFLSLPLLMLGCQKETFQLNQEFTLDFNKAAFIHIEGEEYEIKFIRLVEESRCPPDVVCFWQGQVAVKISLDKNTEITLGLHEEIPASAVYKNHIIQLLEVNFDKKKNYGKENHYSIRLKVE